MTDTTQAIIGLDGLSPTDVDVFDLPGTWDTVDVETVAHTCPSWNAIFSGQDRDDVYDFFKAPASPKRLSGELASHSEDMWAYDDLLTPDFLWESFDVEVVSAPVVLPTLSTLDDPPGLDLTWCTDREEIARSIERLTELTLQHDTVITVYPCPDKMHHIVNDGPSYTAADREEQMASLVDAVSRLTNAFDEWVILSDHGRPTDPEPIPPGDLWVASHEPTGVIRSNCDRVDTTDLTNVSVYDELAALLAA